jgi:uncharacterized protein YeaO (DUF488 family)
MVIWLKRVYESPDAGDGYRILVERLWPRGISKEHAKVDLWIKEAGASPGLRTWFGHDPEKWGEFRRKYVEEIRTRPAVIKELKDVIRSRGSVTFLFAAHDTEHNNAMALKEFLEKEILDFLYSESGYFCTPYRIFVTLCCLCTPDTKK